MIKGFRFATYFILGMFFLECTPKEQTQTGLGKFSVDTNLSKHDIFKNLSEYPELKLFNHEKMESATRTAHIIQKISYSDTFYHPSGSFHFEDYKCKAEYQGDTLFIWLNNNNGYFGNGVLAEVIRNRFLIKDIDPKTLKGEVTFIHSTPTYQKLILNRSTFKRGDSIYGFIEYTSKIDSTITKNFVGYFRTKIK